jgi:hypothetical protein
MNEGKVIEVNFETNVGDWRRVLFWYRWKRLAVEFIIVLVLGVPVLYFLGINIFDFENNAFAALWFFATVFGLFILSLYFGIIRQAESLKRIAEPAKALFSDKGLKTMTDTSSSEKNWERFSNIFETREDFIFFLIENFFFTIPKRFITDEKQITELKQLFREKLGDKAKLKK